MFRLLKGSLLWLLRAQLKPPQAPSSDTGSSELFQASPRYLVQRLSLHFASTLPIVVLETVGWLWSPSSTWLGRRISIAVIAITLALSAIRYFLLRLEYEMRFYLLTDRCLRIRRGILRIEESTYSLENVQTVSLSQGPLDRIFSIASVHIETAGGGATEDPQQPQYGSYHRGRIDGVSVQRARELQQWFTSRLSQYRGDGLGSSDRSKPCSSAAIESVPSLSLDCLMAIRNELKATSPQ